MTARLFTVTGDHLKGTPLTVERRTEALDAVHREYLSEEMFDSGRRTETESGESGRDAPTAGSLSVRETLEMGDDPGSNRPSQGGDPNGPP